MIEFLLILLIVLILYVLFWLFVGAIALAFKLLPFIIVALIIKVLFFKKEE